jgi:hypothetical protein
MTRAALLAIVLLAGCASAPQLPVCAQLSMSAVQTEQGVYYLLTTEQMRALLARMVQLDARKCRLRGEESTV